MQAAARRWTCRSSGPLATKGRMLGPPGSIWPAIEERLLALTAEHRSTIIFANNRRTVEKLTARLNEAALTELPEAAWTGLPNAALTELTEAALLKRPEADLTELPRRISSRIPGRTLRPPGFGPIMEASAWKSVGAPRKAQTRWFAGRCLDGLAGAGHRHGRCGSCLPD